ncbi:hypothetical protein BIFGAL_04414 [Bifidobacterium gallicum DSM 20093 = LMG 11596]|uniref:Uncharacterized protein n=1 Tax=Bifidobacterium gallicum DSM 20093 = LMG 11596 TaxID=561180 RepID=D1NX06_9BIFI|nr:hypothetical protein BIFGAL_04414 [Bifidobacterium gallicum DSM 20093 = LMG 11596]
MCVVCVKVGLGSGWIVDIGVSNWAWNYGCCNPLRSEQAALGHHNGGLLRWAGK